MQVVEYRGLEAAACRASAAMAPPKRALNQCVERNAREAAAAAVWAPDSHVLMVRAVMAAVH